MLKELCIENIAIVKKECVEFPAGFSVLTGETGAGKSIVIDSIGLIMGARSSKELIRSGEKSASVTALFSDFTKNEVARLTEMGFPPEEDNTLFVRRDIGASGSSKAKINGRTVPAAMLSAGGEFLINIHGQHASQALLEEENHITYLDAMADDTALLAEYAEIFEKYSSIRSEIEELKRKEVQKERIVELLKYQIADIDAVKPHEGEEEALEIKKKKIASAEKISKYSNLIYRALYQSEKGNSATDLIRKSADAIEALADVVPKAEEYLETLNDFMYRLEDIAETVYKECDVGVKNPTELLDKIETRLNAISKLKRKYGGTIEEVIAFREKTAAELKTLEHSGEMIDDLANDLADVRARLKAKAAEITQKRKAAASIFEEKIVSELRFLEMGKVRFKIAVEPLAEFAANGGDAVSFLVSANPGEPLMPLSRIASGGELSRTMLALKCALADKEKTPTLIFDEIDTGISGKTSHKIGIKLKEVASRDTQVICVTHSPQIAATANTHFFVSKREVDGRTESSIRALEYDERVTEIARIIGGAKITPQAEAAARDLIDGGK
ncbi:MAG: DNA repair protein RecN [Clostridia bacterium]|nr:DNA repair protein RecN [Clostridia bacterium]